MALDVDKFQGLANENVQENQAAANKPAPSFFDEALDTVENAASGVATFVENTASDIKDAAVDMMEAQGRVEVSQFGSSEERADAARSIEKAAPEVITSPFKELSRDIVNNYADDNNSMLQGLAQSLRSTDTYLNYYMTDDEKLQKAKDIEDVTGINAQAVLTDNDTYKKALEIYDYTNKEKALGKPIEEVWKEFPGLEDMAKTDPQSAALALHDIKSVRDTKTIIQSFTEMLEYGNKQLEYKNLNYKLMNGKATDEDKARLAELGDQLKEEPDQPSFWQNPLAAIAGGVASSAPEMIQSFGEMGRDFAIGAAAGAVAGAALGGIGAAPGALGSGLANATRSYLMRQAAINGAKLMAGYAGRYGMFAGMARPEMGSYFAQFKDMKDKDGKPLLSDDAAEKYAATAGVLNAGIEMLNFEVAKNAIFGNVFKDAVKGIVDGVQSDATTSAAIKNFFKNRAASLLEVTGSESAENGLQSVSDDIIHNQIEADTGDKSNKIFTAKDIAAHAVEQMGEALPGAFGFGLVSGIGGTISSTTALPRTLKRLMSNDADWQLNARKTFSGAMMIDQLQNTVRNSKLKDTAPQAQEKLIRDQLQGTGFEMAYVDTETALKKENGMQDLDKLATAAGYSQQDLQTAIDTKGTMAVPVEKFAQAETSPNILQAVSFDAESEPLGKIADTAKEITKQMNEKIQRSVDNQMKITDAVLNEVFPEKETTKEERDTAQAAIYTKPDNPRAGWQELYKNAVAEKAEIIAPALQTLKNGMGNGVDIVKGKSDEEGNIKVSNNDQWYRDFYKSHKRAPNQTELENMAVALTAGRENAPTVQGWTPTTPEEAKAFKENDQRLTALESHIANLENIKEKMNSLTGVEMRLTQGLTPEGYSVYRQLTGQLEKAGGKTARAARMDAILFVRHADIVAKIISDKTGKEYTALDYYKERFGLDVKNSKRNGLQQLPAQKNLIADEKKFAKVIDDFMVNKNVNKSITVMTTPLVMNLAGAPILPINISRAILHKILKDKHNKEMSPEIVKQIPRALTNPMMIIKSVDKYGNVLDNEHVVIVDLKDKNGDTVIVPFVLNVKEKHYTVNKIKSAYGKEALKPETKWFNEHINEENVLYINRKKTTDWVQSFGAPDGSRRHSLINNLSKLNIANENDLVNLQNANTAYYQGEKGNIAKMSDGQRIISLYETADESTFVHEMSHMFLMDLDDLAKIDMLSKKELDIVNEWAAWDEKTAGEYKDTPWAKEFAARHNSIMSARDAGDIEAETKLKEQWRQERFARAFELYLKKGTAPAKGLKSVFRKFKKFLRDIYIGFTSTGGTASPKVEAVMARMIATEDEINEAMLDDRYKDISKAGGEKLLMEKEQDTYKRWQEEAAAEAKEKLMVIVMKDMTAEVQRKVADRVAAEKTKKQAELENQNIYLAQTAVEQTGDKNMVLNWYPSIETYEEELRNTLPLEKALDNYISKYEKQINEQMQNSRITDENIAEAMESTPYHKKLIAFESSIMAQKEQLINRVNSKAKLAMQDVADRLDALPDDVDLKIDKEDKNVKEVMQAINRLRFASKWTTSDFYRIENMIKSATKEEAKDALKEFKNNARQENINRKAVEQATEGKMKMYKELARKNIAMQPIFQATNFIKYRQAEKTHAKYVQQAMNGQNWHTAMKQKEMQYIAAEMANEAKKTDEHVNDLVKKVNDQLKARSIRLPAQERYWLQHLAYKLRIAKEDAIMPVEGVTPLGTLFDQMKESLDIEYTPEEILTLADKQEFAGYKSLQVNEFEDAVEALTILYTTGRDKFKMKTIAGKDIKDIVDEILNDKTSYNGLKVQQRNANPDRGGLGYNDLVAKAPLIGETLARGGAKYLASMMKPEEIIKMIGEKAHKYLYGTYERAGRHEARIATENINKVKEILSDYTHKEKMQWQKKQYQFIDKNDLYTKEQVICMALNLGNETNTSRLVAGMSKNGAISEEQVRDFIYKNMTKKDWQLVQNVWDHLHSFWADTQKVEEKLTGVILRPVEATQFDVQLNGETIHMKGGYYPIAADPAKSIRADDKTVDEAARRQMSGAQVLGTGRGFTKARSEHEISRMLRLDFDVIPEHLGGVIHNITHRLAARDVYRLINDTRFTEMVQSTFGTEAYKVLRQWSTDVWKTLPENNNQSTSLLEKTASYLRRNATLAIMGYRLYPVLENITNIFPIMDKIGATKAIAAVGDFYANRSKYVGLLHKSVFMRNRINNMDRDIKNIPGLFNEDRLVTGWLKEHAYTMMVYSDLMFSAPLWVRAYKDAFQGKLEETIAENENNKKAFADAQAGLTNIRAKITDTNNNKRAIDNEISSRRFNVLPQERDGRFTGFRDDELQRQSINSDAEIKDLKKQLFDAQIKLDKATDLKIMNEKEILAEAEQRSIEEADGAVRDVFSSGETKDLASIQKGSEINKLFTSFYSFFNSQANAILGAYYQGKFSDKGKFMRWMPAAKAVMYRIILTSAVSTILKMALTGDGSDDNDKYRKEKDADGKDKKVEIPIMERFLNQLYKNILSTATGTMWGIRDIASLYINMAFEGTDYNKGINFGSVTFQLGDKIAALTKLAMAKGERDLKIADQEAKREAAYKKMSKKQRKTYDKNRQYQKPVKRITYTDIAKSALGIATSVTAAKTGITDTMANSVLTTMQYMNDTDGRYDPSLKNIMWSAMFNKKPVERAVPEKPEVPKKKKRRTRK